VIIPTAAIGRWGAVKTADNRLFGETIPLIEIPALNHRGVNHV
jgi:hypothetical protein